MNNKENPRLGQKLIRIANGVFMVSALTACDLWSKPALPTPLPPDGAGRPAPTHEIPSPTSTTGLAARPTETATAVPSPRTTETRTRTSTPTEVPFVSQVIIPTPAEGQREGVPLSVKFEIRQDLPGASTDLRENIKPTLEEYVLVMTVTTMDIISWLQKQQSVDLSNDQRLQLNQQRVQIEQQMIAFKGNTTNMLLSQPQPAPAVTAVPLRQRPDIVRPQEAVLFYTSSRPGLPFTTIFEIDEKQAPGALKETVRSSLAVYSNLTSEMTADLLNQMQAQKGKLTDQQKAQFETQLLGFRQSMSQILLSGPVQ